MRKKVIFDKPSHGLLKALGKTCVDMHFHTCYSDSNVQIPDLLHKAKKLGIGVAITDHNEIGGSLAAAKNIDNVMIIPGIEVSCIDGPHILLYFYSFRELKEFFDKNVLPYRGANPYLATTLKTKELLDSTKGYNCVRVAAHPYGYLIANNGLSKAIRKTHVESSVMKHIEGLEVICGALNRRLNKLAVDQASLLGRAYTGGTDGHSLFQLGQVLTISDAQTREEFLDSIVKRRNIVVGTEVPMVPKLVPASHMIKTHAVDYTMPTIKLQSKLLYGRALSLKGRVARRVKEHHVTRTVTKKLNGMMKKSDF